ncbi:hypothetical protein FHL15_003238 [Xylaria flabelliformis]|uniref:Uncharacterized protein n=1 Tax=Xylaria flabelliformis TaxID=2512241 RepID=A0A553I689_9PEZI|nr:hypothetical protein FHL15_003238 [Xylaria flabelliformis]
MTVTTSSIPAKGFRVDHAKLNEDLNQLLKNVDGNLNHYALGSYSGAYKTIYKATMRSGIESLLGTISIANSQAWEDVVAYGREVILAPEDTAERALSPWARSCSDLHKELLKRFGPETVKAAELGTASIIENHFNGDRLAIPHVNKKASYLRHRHDAKVGAGFYPKSSPLAATCYQCASMPCSLAMSWFLPIEKAVQAAYISHLSVCDDVGSFTEEDYAVRMRMVTISAGVAYRFGGKALNVFVDGTSKQAVGMVAGELKPLEAAMAWRAVGGCSTIYSKYNFDECDLKVGLVAPLVMMALHDLLDWRCDVSAGNHENAVSAVYGFGIEAPFHAFLEAMLEEVLKHPRSGVYGIGAVTYMHFVVGRYGAWEYRGQPMPACEKCIGLLREATEAAGLEWAPKSPPKRYVEGDEAREWGRLWSDHFVDEQLLVQEAVSWFQYLISSGEIWLFDLFSEGVRPVDEGADWA